LLEAWVCCYGMARGAPCPAEVAKTIGGRSGHNEVGGSSTKTRDNTRESYHKEEKMKKTLLIMLAVGLTVCLAGSAPSVMADGTTTVCVGNIPLDGIAGGTEHGLCSTDPEEQDQWHFVINGLRPRDAAPAEITAVFLKAGTVQIPQTRLLGPSAVGTAHYTLKGRLLDDTLLNAYAHLSDGTSYRRFVLSHAPCGSEGFDFSISLDPDSHSIMRPLWQRPTVSVSTNAKLELILGETQPVTLAVSNAPVPVTFPDGNICSPDPDHGCSITVVFDVDHNAPVGGFHVTFTATGGGKTRSAVFRLTIDGEMQP